MEKERKAFNFFKSYYEVYKMLPTPQAKDDFITALCEKQFFGIEPDCNAIDLMAKFAYMSQKHSIDSSRQGFDDVQKRKPNKGGLSTPSVGGSKGGLVGPSVQEQVKEQEQEKEKEKVEEKKFNFRSALLSLGVDEKLVSEWMQVRKDKKATNTETAFKNIKTEIEKSGLPAQDCIEMAVVGSWKGFKAEWIKQNNTQKKAHQSERQNYEFNI